MNGDIICGSCYSNYDNENPPNVVTCCDYSICQNCIYREIENLSKIERGFICPYCKLENNNIGNFLVNKSLLNIVNNAAAAGITSILMKQKVLSFEEKVEKTKLAIDKVFYEIQSETAKLLDDMEKRKENEKEEHLEDDCKALNTLETKFKDEVKIACNNYVE